MRKQAKGNVSRMFKKEIAFAGINFNFSFSLGQLCLKWGDLTSTQGFKGHIETDGTACMLE